MTAFEWRVEREDNHTHGIRHIYHDPGTGKPLSEKDAATVSHYLNAAGIQASVTRRIVGPWEKAEV